MWKIRKYDHLIACNDYFAQFLVLKYAFPIKEVGKNRFYKFHFYFCPEKEYFLL